MAWSEPSDQIAINDRDEEATWQRVGRSIARAISAVDLHLSEEGYWQDRVRWMRYNLDRWSQWVITVEIQSIENTSDASNRNPTAGVNNQMCFQSIYRIRAFYQSH